MGTQMNLDRSDEAAATALYR